MTSLVTPVGPLMVFLEGVRLSAGERALLRRREVGGVIFFSRNYNNKQQLSELVHEIRSITPHLVLAVDHEGGRVQRLRRGFTCLPPMRRLGELFDREPARALRLAYAAARVSAVELREIGIDTGFSPVLDLFKPCNAIGDRALHSAPGAVTELARALVRGLLDGGLLPVGKHFPGHGTVVGDTHDEVVEDRREYKDIAAADLKVFRDLVMDKALPAVMVAHVVYPRVDTRPASLSGRWLRQTLRGELGFDGLVFSDDLAMRGIRAEGSEASVKRTLEAGCDMVLICNDRELLRRALAELSGEEACFDAEQLGQRWKHIHQELMSRSSKDNQVAWELGAAREELSSFYPGAA